MAKHQTSKHLSVSESVPVAVWHVLLPQRAYPIILDGTWALCVSMSDSVNMPKSRDVALGKVWWLLLGPVQGICSEGGLEPLATSCSHMLLGLYYHIPQKDLKEILVIKRAYATLGR